jgi:hypothetical protein
MALSRLGVVLALFVAVACAPTGDLRTKGTMPPADENGNVDPRLAPDFIGVANPNGDGIIGWVAKEYLFHEVTSAPGLPEQPDIPVYADDLTTLIGHMVPGRGFVPLGVNPEAVPARPVQVGPSPAPAVP